MGLLSLALAPGFALEETNRLPRAVSPRWQLSFGAACLVPYLVYALGTGDFHWTALGKLAGLAAFVWGIYAIVPVRNLPRFSWQDAVIALALIAAVLLGWLKHVWNRPVHLDFMERLFTVAIAAGAWRWVRPLPEFGYRLKITASELREAGRQFAFFTVVAVPLSLALHFTRWDPRWPGWWRFLASYLEIFLFIALLEELFFRGFLQQLLSSNLRSWWRAQLLVSICFGFFHILHAPFPNWRYVLLATIAGWFYGSAFRKTGSVTASAMMHAAVDTVWRTWLLA